MRRRLLFIPFGVLALSLTAIGCGNSLNDVRKIYFSEFSPTGEADDIDVKYTDSGRIGAVLVSPKMLDYATVDYPFTEFPKGVNVTLYDKKGQKTFIRSDYAVQFKGTELIDLRGNVTITSENGSVMNTEQLYFDQKNDWFYTEKPFTFKNPKSGSTRGQGIDFSKDFKRVNFQRVSGLINESE
ncbi:MULTISPECIES: LPS export ABC transporter periplasmic protein LptC [unclassified Flavobacterium]|uniref:LPS export ABC transporter periplasmic protein LptC n=1 Tax=unclassified Flavobacterium TaxID=196869 RepID=UPI001F12BCC6|nr:MULTISPECIES: LPS export ABC transporter periplasmic protein LptC [unclassified Flavobacterium]UMY65946.1 LPS export ABC transporter periplasmic protein LptC [Flavobacterium sp. HJ-32-4]